jgi:hypothetical protein
MALLGSFPTIGAIWSLLRNVKVAVRTVATLCFSFVLIDSLCLLLSRSTLLDCIMVHDRLMEGIGAEV